jgi:hypothetical protein
MSHRSIACLLVSIVVAAGCGGGQSEATQPTNAAPSASTPPVATEAPPPSATSTGAPAPSATVAATPPAPTPPGPGEWDTWSHDKKLMWMKTGVMPKMGQLFHDYDSKTYADPKCGLCHGAGAKDGSFKMPNPDLPKLPSTPAEFQKLAQSKPKVVDFMNNMVKSTMASLVGEAPMDPKTGKGFGCFECHTKK